MDCDVVRVIAPLSLIASPLRIATVDLLQTDDKLSSRYTLLELVQAALQTFEAFANDSGLGRWSEAAVFESLGQVVLIDSF